MNDLPNNTSSDQPAYNPQDTSQDQPQNRPQDQPQDQQTTQPAVQKPEGGGLIYEKNNSPEIPTNQKDTQEIYPTPEKNIETTIEKQNKDELPSLNEQVKETQKQETINSLQNTKTEEVKQKIVDKTDKIQKLDHIKDPGDSLTKEADEEEEKFIEEVEKHHGHI